MFILEDLWECNGDLSMLLLPQIQFRLFEAKSTISGLNPSIFSSTLYIYIYAESEHMHHHVDKRYRAEIEGGPAR